MKWCNGRGEQCGGVSHKVVWSKSMTVMVVKSRTEQMEKKTVLEEREKVEEK